MSATSPRTGPVLSALVVSALAFGVTAGRARAGDTEDARAYADKATAAFALAHYAQAAENFEKAFELRSDPALLYNAAQSHRLAGNKDRALTLYRNYLRLYAKKEKRAEIEARIDELEKAIAQDKATRTNPPTTTEPIGSGPPSPPAAQPPAPEAAPPPPAPVTVAPEPAPSAAPILVAQPAPAARDDSLVSKPWFWIAVGGGVAAAVIVVLLLSRGGASDPSPSIGRIDGN